MRFGVVVFPGSNCDRDCHHVLSAVMGVDAEYVWHRDTDLGGLDAVIVPGGFSYGDYLRAGAIAKISPVMGAVRDFAERGGPVLDVCNGFQILLECDLLPGAMLSNDTLRFTCTDVHLKVENADTPYTSTLSRGDVIRLPIANAEGNYTIDESGLAMLHENEQVVFRYCEPSGAVTPGANPNGSMTNIAGIRNRPGNVLGMMPHPERACEAILGNVDGRALFESAIESVAG